MSSRVTSKQSLLVARGVGKRFDRRATAREDAVAAITGAPPGGGRRHDR